MSAAKPTLSRRLRLALGKLAAGPAGPAAGRGLVGLDPMIVAFGRAVRILRLTRRLSESELAEAAGITLAQLASIEAGRQDPPFDVAFALACALEVKPSGLAACAEACQQDASAFEHQRAPRVLLA